MFSIGDFARHGRVSVRMLRHYDALGLLRPARVDPSTGYRWYSASQLRVLNRIVALKDLGFTLEQVKEVIDGKVTASEMRAMLTLRQAQLRSQIDADVARLSQVEARLQLIEREGAMPTDDVQVKRLPEVRVAQLSANAGGFAPEWISPVIKPLYGELIELIRRAGVTPVGPGIAYYRELSDGVAVHASLPVNAEPRAEYGFEIVDLPEFPCAATVIHHGSMDNVLSTLQILATWIDANDYRIAGPPRELYLECDGDESTWVTELQQPIETSGEVG